MERTCTLVIDIKSYWHPGTGRGLGTQLDAVTHRSSRGLPELPGRTVKGLLRDAVNRYRLFGGYNGVASTYSVAVVDQLFGPYGEEGTETWPGLLRVADATLPAEEADYLTEDRNRALLEGRYPLSAGLYRSHFSTRIDHETGTAAEKTLRGIELVVPLKLRAQITTVPTARYSELEDRWPELLRQALSLVRSVGAHRSRGLGRAVLNLEEVKA